MNNPIIPSSNALQPTQRLLPTLADKVDYCLSTYGDFKQFSNVFSLANMQTYVHYPTRCVCGNAPTLLTASEAYGINPIIQWLMTLFVGVSEFTGAKDKITTYQLQKLANKFYDRNRDLKVTEVMLFMDKLESGDFGRISWQSVDPVSILDKVDNFRTSCRLIVQREEQRLADIRDAEERKRAVPCPPEIKERLSKFFKNLAANSHRKESSQSLWFEQLTSNNNVNTENHSSSDK